MALGIGEGIAAAKLALDSGNKALDELRRPSVEPEKIRNHLITMQDHVLSAKTALSEAEDENRELRRQIEDMQRAFELRTDMVYVTDGGFYTRTSEGGSIPYCPVCWQKDGKTIPLNSVETAGLYQCGVDSTTYKTQAYRDHRASQLAATPRRARARDLRNSWME